LCRMVAEHMGSRWEIDVVTTCARSYITWENEYEPGVASLNGVTVRRFPVDQPRDTRVQAELQPRIQPSNSHTRDDEMRWMRAQGPYSTPLLRYLRERRLEYDGFFFFTYLYCTTCLGLPLVADRAILVPTAHDEDWLDLKIIKELFSQPQGFVFLTPEEQALVHTRFGNEAIPSVITGIGMEEPRDADPERFRRRHGIRGRFVLYLGRVDQFKGCPEMFDFFIKSRSTRSSEVTLVLIGPVAVGVPAHPNIVVLGALGEQDKHDALASAEALIQPSLYESLSIVLLEAWLAGTPVLVNGRCAVLKGQCRRAQGGLWYDTEYEFDEALSLLLSDGDLRQRLAANGKRYVEANYSWERIGQLYREIAARTLPHTAGVTK